MSKFTGIELKCAQLVPSAVFAGPHEVVSSSVLSVAQKIVILRRWEFDLRRCAVTIDAVNEDSPLLKEVQGALAALGAAPQARSSPPPDTDPGGRARSSLQAAG